MLKVENEKIMIIGENWTEGKMPIWEGGKKNREGSRMAKREF
jgi:hypothetical protein